MANKSHKFTTEQLSRVLGEHEAGTLIRNGQSCWGKELFGLSPPKFYTEGPKCCVNQAAFNEPMVGLAASLHLISIAFDEEYDSAWSTEEFLAFLEKHGAA